MGVFSKQLAHYAVVKAIEVIQINELGKLITFFR
jgi:hypothetical protein